MVVHGHRRVMLYQRGDYFGEIALMKNVARRASVMAETACNVVSIDRQAFTRLLGSCVSLRKYMFTGLVRELT